MDARVNANPLVYGEPGIRFYAGAPLIVPDGTAGMVCVLDSKVREGVSPAQETPSRSWRGESCCCCRRACCTAARIRGHHRAEAKGQIRVGQTCSDG